MERVAIKGNNKNAAAGVDDSGMPAGAEALRYEAPLVQVNNSVSDDLLIRSMFNESTQQDVDGEQILQGIIQDAPSCLRACAIAPDCVAAVFRVWRKVPSCNLYRTVRRLLTVFKTTLYTKNVTAMELPAPVSVHIKQAQNVSFVTSEFVRREGRSAVYADATLHLVNSSDHHRLCLAACYALDWCVVVVVQGGTCVLGRAWGALNVRAPAVSYGLTTRNRQPTAKVRVVYALLAGPSYLSTRVRVALSTWLRHEEVVLFIEDGFGAVAQELVDNVSLRLNAKPINCTVVSLPVPSSRVVLGNKRRVEGLSDCAAPSAELCGCALVHDCGRRHLRHHPQPQCRNAGSPSVERHTVLHRTITERWFQSAHAVR